MSLNNIQNLSVNDITADTIDVDYVNDISRNTIDFISNLSSDAQQQLNSINPNNNQINQTNLTGSNVLSYTNLKSGLVSNGNATFNSLIYPNNSIIQSNIFNTINNVLYETEFKDDINQTAGTATLGDLTVKNITQQNNNVITQYG